MNTPVAPSTFGTSLRRCAWLLLGLVAGAVSDLRPQAETATGEGVLQDVIELPPFVVDASGDVGYLAQNTLAGTRLNAPLRDISAAISVMTQEFINDIGADDTNDLLDYALNTERAFDFGGRRQLLDDVVVNARNLGLSPVGRPVARNYFLWFLSSDSYNTDQVTFSRGPNSILFGLGDAGGIINTSTKQPFFGNQYDFKAKFDSEGSMRYTTDLNQILLENRLALRVNTLYQDEKDWQALDYDRQQRLYLAGKYRFADKGRTSLRFDFEVADVERLLSPNAVAANQFQEWIRNWSENSDSPNVAALKLENGVDPTSRRFAGATNLNNTYGLDAYGAGTLVYLPETGQFHNAGGFTRAGSPTEGSLYVNDFNLVPRHLSLRGPSATSDYDYWTWSAYLEHRFFEKVWVELAFNQQSEDRLVRNPAGNGLFVDTNTVDFQGQPNPHLGQFYTQGAYTETTRTRDIDNIRLMATYEWQGEEWGKHNLALMAAYENFTQQLDTFAEINTTPLEQEQWYGRNDTGYIANPRLNNLGLLVNQNYLYRRTYLGQGYLSLADGPTHHLDIDAHPLPTQVVPASVVKYKGDNEHSGQVTPGMAPTEYEAKEERVGSLLLASQSKFFKDRLVFTLGWRMDEYKSRVVQEELDEFFVNESYRQAALDYLERNTKTPASSTDPIVLRNRETFLRDVALVPTTPQKDFTDALEGRMNTQTAGAVYHLTPWLAPFVNYSNNFGPQSKRGLLIEENRAAESVGNLKGMGYDLGAKFFLFGNKLVATAQFFFTEASNVAYDTEDSITRSVINDVWRHYDDIRFRKGLGAADNRIEPYFDTRDARSSGMEFNVISNDLIPRVRFQVNYSYAVGEEDNIRPRARSYYHYWLPTWKVEENEFTDPPNNSIPFLVQIDRLRKLIEQYDLLEERQILHNHIHRVNAFAKYSFPKDTFLEGLSVGLGARYKSAPIIAYTDEEAERVGGQRGLERKGVDQLFFDLTLTYQFQLFRDKVDARIQINVQNLFDEDKLDWRGFGNDDEDPLKLTYTTYQFFEPRTIALSVEFGF